MSEGAKNLLTKMLVVNPLNRITIHEIMQDEWFTTNISEYLLPNDVPKNHVDKKLTKMQLMLLLRQWVMIVMKLFKL